MAEKKPRVLMRDTTEHLPFMYQLAAQVSIDMGDAVMEDGKPFEARMRRVVH